MNKVILSGRIATDLKVQNTQSGLIFTRFNLAVVRDGAKDSNGQKITDFLNCTAFGQQANFLCTYCHKGDMILAEGKIQTSKYTKPDGTQSIGTSINIDKVESIRTSNAQGNVENKPAQQMQGGYQQPQYQPQQSVNEAMEVYDEDLPF